MTVDITNPINGKTVAHAEHTSDGIGIFDAVTGKKKYHINKVPVVVVDNSPCVAPLLAGTFGSECWLDATFYRIDFLDYVRNMRKIHIGICSANPDFTGNIVIAFMVDGEESELVTIPCGADITVFQHEFQQPITGHISIFRKFEHPDDTLRDGDPITAIISDISLIYIMEA